MWHCWFHKFQTRIKYECKSIFGWFASLAVATIGAARIRLAPASIAATWCLIDWVGFARSPHRENQFQQSARSKWLCVHRIGHQSPPFLRVHFPHTKFVKCKREKKIFGNWSGRVCACSLSSPFTSSQTNVKYIVYKKFKSARCNLFGISMDVFQFQRHATTNNPKIDVRCHCLWRK